MSATTAAFAAPATPAQRLSARAAFYLQASITLSFLAGSSAPTPLYALYQAQWGFSPITTTLVFGIYALAVLAALLVVGRLSDHVGRRPVLLVAALAQAAAMAVFATADGVPALMAARILQGMATGAAVAAVGAGLLDLDKARGTVANSIAPMIGTALGGFVAGLMVQYLPAPTHLVYAVLGTVFVLQAIGVAFMPESIAARPGAWASLVPQFSLPVAVREPMLRAVPALVATWALAGFYASLGPTLVHNLVGHGSPLLGGLALFVLASSGGVAVLAMQRRDARAMSTFGASVLLVGVMVAIAALSTSSLGVFLLGTALAGAGFGTAFQGAVRSVVAVATPQERAGVLSVVFVVSYLAMGLPAVLAGALLVEQGSILTTAREFGGVVIGLAALALLGAVAKRSR